MNSLSGYWSGRTAGTNNAAIFVEFIETNGSITGSAKVNDPINGISAFTLAGKRTGDLIHFKMTPTPNNPSMSTFQARVMGRPISVEIAPTTYGPGEATGKIINNNKIEGHWGTQINTAGTFLLERQAQNSDATDGHKAGYQATVYSIMISAPSDADIERKIVHNTIFEWMH